MLDKAQVKTAGLQFSVPDRTSPHPSRYNADGSGGPGPKYLRTEELLGRHGDSLGERLIVRLTEKLLGIDKVNAVCDRAGRPWPSSHEMIDHLFRELNIKWEIANPEVFDRLEGRQAIFVANHPYGMADAFAVNNMLERHRPNFRLFANQFLTMADSITHKLLFVDPLMSEKHRAMNRRAVTAAIRHLKAGGDLALFPGRYCSHLRRGETVVQDTEWSDQIRIFVEATSADLVPMHISGQNSPLFQYAGLVHPKLRTLRILREFLRGNREFTITLGDPVPAEEVTKASSVTSPGLFARALTYQLKREPRSGDTQEAIAGEPAAAAVARASSGSRGRMEATLEQSTLLVERKNFQVFAANHEAAAPVMTKLSELRYAAFKNELPVSGPADMIDSHDDYYSHLLLWDSQNRRLAGAYRYLIPGDTETPANSNQIISSTIFKFGPELERLIPHSIELGRVAVSPDYQKSYHPLMMLWRAILSLVARDPQIRLIYGPIALSPSFTPLSLEIIRRWLLRHAHDKRWSPHVSALVEPDMRIPPEIDVDALIADCDTIAKLNVLVTAIERGRRPLPTLLRHYSTAGTTFPCFGTWPQFDDALTTLVIMDVQEFRPEFLQRYLGKDVASKMLADRGLQSG